MGDFLKELDVETVDLTIYSIHSYLGMKPHKQRPMFDQKISPRQHLQVVMDCQNMLTFLDHCVVLRVSS